MRSKAKTDINWWDKRPVLIVGGLVGLLFVYILGSLALGTGSLLQYFGTLLLLVLSIKLLARFFMGINN